MLPITIFYTLISGVLFITLSVRTILARRHFRVGLGDGENEVLKRRIRAHANFSEYVPFTLLVLLLLEIHQADTAILHLVGGALIVGRCLHVVGIERLLPGGPFRELGMACTFTAIMTGLLSLTWLMFTI